MDENEKKERKIMKKVALICALIGVIGGAFYGGMEYGRLLPASHRYYSNSQVYATIGDEEITGKDLKTVMEPIFYSNGLQKLNDSEISSYESNMLQYLVNMEVLYKEAEENNVEVTDDQVQQNYDQTISSINSEYNLTEEEYLDKFNLTEEKLKERIKKELMGATYLEQYSNVSEEEAKNYYEKNKDDYKQVRASHILISNYDTDNKEVSDEQKKKNKETAEEVLKLALDGEDFASLAKEFSDDSSASSGGDLGYFIEDDMVSSFSKAAFSLEDGEIYPEVVETTSGYHIIKKTGEKEQDFDDVKDDLITTLKNTKQTTLMQDLYSKYNVDIKN
ncbi:peptidylprolyl isomerase [Intestinibacter sp.]|uniref:peptidylprolyl isomerase n=1 Tax=Intestinibacter sp. TaxID=1965304 RepID=UPI002A7632FF|nr:peptidylprolyl isomerase [Intestinibacter sp.]MDY2737399.1 peptidylprolyl isomerase [Intestinibacter sp.]MDY4576267.1 peptidylprolyl isomerase [Intestinibacter sp.]